MRWISLAAALGSLSCNTLAGPGGDPAVLVEASAVRLNPVVGIVTATLTNQTTEDLMLKVRCTAVELDQAEGETWTRIHDLRLCAVPNLMRLPAQTTLTVTDQRALAAGRYRVVIESDDGRLSYSEGFVVPAQ